MELAGAECSQGLNAPLQVAQPALDHCGSVRAFYSNDFDWETLRAEIESSDECEAVGGCNQIISKDRPFEVDQAHFVEAAQRKEQDDIPHAFTPSAWEIFHKNHSKALFFKERRYLVTEFPELLPGTNPSRILEVGCGTGSSVVPILRANKKAIIFGCDCSSAALERASAHVIGQAGSDISQLRSFHPFLCDISAESLPSWLCCSSCREPCKQGEMQNEKQTKECTRGDQRKKGEDGGTSQPANCCIGGVDTVTLIFTLSAIPVELMHHVLDEVSAVLRPGGWLLFRDYGLYDMTMLRFPMSQRVSDRLYHRKDGTLSYYFTMEVVRQLFTKVGLVEVELNYCCVELTNRRKEIPMRRVWVHGKFQKPAF